MSSDRFISVGGTDRTADLGTEIADAATRRTAPDLAARVEREAAILELADASDNEAYLAAQLELIRTRCGIDPADFELSSRPGRLGRITARIRALLWRGLRYQHEWMAFQQSGVNRQLVHALEFERDAREKETEELRERISQLEARLQDKDGSK